MIAEHVLPLTVKQHLAALRRAEAWAVRLGYELAEAVGAPLQIQALILQALGLPLDQAKGRLAAYGEYEAADDAAVMAECERVVLERCRKEPEYAAVLLAKVNGRNGVSHATEVVT